MDVTKPTKVHRVTLLVIDHDDLGAEEVCAVLSDTRYPNRCIHPEAKHVETREVEWHDRHPLNYRDTADEAYRALFGGVEIEHDPDDGCAGCPLVSSQTETTNDREGYVDVPICGLTGYALHQSLNAPTWCPLRSGPVTVRRPSVTSADE